MKVPINELKKYLQTNATNNQIADKLTQIGFEVEEIFDYSEVYKNFVIGKVLSAEKHPNADKLNVCQVDIGGGVNQIVCGASNVRAGLTVVVCLEGAVVPKNGLIIKKAVLRGVESNGMICSESELCLSDESEGILELDNKYNAGEKFSTSFLQDDTVLTLNITPNRGDCCGLIGVARELVASNLGTLETISYSKDVAEKRWSTHPINQFASNFGEIEISNCDKIISPTEITNALFKFGIKSVDFLTDISNFVMFSTGLPIFIKEKTIECFYINPVDFAKNNQDIKGDTKYRFERGIDRSQIANTLNFAGNLIKKFGGNASAVYIVELEKNEPKTIRYNFSNYKKLIGADVNQDKACDILNKLAFEVSDNFDGTITCATPLHRHDISIEADITEELARIIGYDKIEPKYAFPFETIGDNKIYDNLLNIKKIISNKGLIEVLNFSFVDKNDAIKFGCKIQDNLELANPISGNLNYMRPTLLIGLLNNLSQNIAKHKTENIAIFEEGAVFSFGQNQEQIISGVMMGNAIVDDHLKEGRKYDLFDTKMIIDHVVQGVIKKETINFAHPYRCFSVWQNDVQVARYGEIHPKIAKNFDLQQTIIFFEIFAEKIAVKNIIKNDYSLHPIVKDMAFIVHNDILVGDMIYQIGDIVDNIIVFDVYQGDGIEANHKSVMFRMTINPKTELSSDDINVIMIKISQILDSKFGAKLRGEL